MRQDAGNWEQEAARGNRGFISVLTFDEGGHRQFRISHNSILSSFVHANDIPGCDTQWRSGETRNHRRPMIMKQIPDPEFSST